MPELPEVETTTRALNKILPGQKIVRIENAFFSPLPRYKETIKNKKFFANFQKALLGQKILKVHRRGKNILIDLSGGQTILVHLKMTGHLLYGKYQRSDQTWLPQEDGPLKDPFNRFIRVVFELENGRTLAFCDARKFGKITFFQSAKINSDSPVNKLGPDPTKSDFDWQKLKERLLKKPKTRLKAVLLDQEIVAGIGNIYSDEALYLAEIHPEKIPQNLKDQEFKKLCRAIKKVLKKGIDLGGDSTSDYRRPDGTPGKFHLKHQVYARKGKLCQKKNCAGVIERKVIAGRSAHFCPIHQV